MSSFFGKEAILSAVLLVSFVCPSFVAGEDVGHHAARILQAGDRPAGLVHLPRCGDGSLALALALANEDLGVHGQDSDLANVAAAKKAADRMGLLNRRIGIDQGGLDRLLPVGRSAGPSNAASFAGCADICRAFRNACRLAISDELRKML